MRDLEATPKLPSETNARLVEESSAAGRAQRDLAQAIEAIEEGLTLWPPPRRLELAARPAAPCPSDRAPPRYQLRHAGGAVRLIWHVDSSEGPRLLYFAIGGSVSPRESLSNEL
jgi:hypothetical protein